MYEIKTTGTFITVVHALIFVLSSDDYGYDRETE